LKQHGDQQQRKDHLKRFGQPLIPVHVQFLHWFVIWVLEIPPRQYTTIQSI
jgi:hypothetical protein